MSTKKKNKRLIVIIAVVLAAAIAIGVTVSVIVSRSSTDTQKTTDCKATIAEVHAQSSKEPVYEPPAQYFKCINAF